MPTYKLSYTDKTISTFTTGRMNNPEISKSIGLIKENVGEDSIILYTALGRELARGKFSDFVNESDTPFASLAALETYLQNNFFIDASAETLAEAKTYADSKIVGITQAAYNALPVKVTGTLYCITG